ncbi:MAG: hypothetical protein KBG28_22590 [Kofleriaceae bacterium]|nr:hypothetical protein [Kofleriaceae bacterium]
MIRTQLFALVIGLGLVAPAAAQPLPPLPTPTPTPTPTPGGTADPTGAPVPPDAGGDTPADPYDPSTTVVTLAPPAPAAPAKPAPPPRPTVDLPEVLTTPTGWLLPAGVLYSRSGVDTGGGVSSDLRVGLGDVAEFGVATSDSVRFRTNDAELTDRLQPFVTATFRMGLAEDRLFPNQPGVTLGFRKSFVHERENTEVRTAELTLVASKHLGKRAAVHAGGAFWDASLTPPDAAAITLHDGKLGNQIRGFGGLEFRPLDQSQILIDLGWTPEFCVECSAHIKLRAVLSWGVRYQVRPWFNIESGVRVPDIQDANLLDAQIFGQVTFVSWRLRDTIDALR